MPTWTLRGGKQGTSIQFGGPDADAAHMSIQGRGEIEFDKRELQYKKTTDSAIAALNSIHSSRFSWEIRDDIYSIQRALKNAYSYGYDRSEWATRVVEKCGNRAVGLVAADIRHVFIVVSTSVFEKLYSLFEALLTTADERRICYTLRGDFDLGIEQVQDHRPTPEEFASGGPLVSNWVEISFDERHDPNFN